MVINKNGLITENQNTQDNYNLNEQEPINLNTEVKDFDLNSNNYEFSNEIEYNKNIDVPDSPINQNEDEEKTVETNCLALTVRKDYNLSIVKNTIFKTIRMSVKVAISTLILNLIKIFL